MKDFLSHLWVSYITWEPAMNFQNNIFQGGGGCIWTTSKTIWKEFFSQILGGMIVASQQISSDLDICCHIGASYIQNGVMNRFTGNLGTISAVQEKISTRHHLFVSFVSTYYHGRLYFNWSFSSTSYLMIITDFSRVPSSGRLQKNRSKLFPAPL